MSIINVNKSSEELTAEMLAEVPDKYQKTVGFFLWDTLRAIAIVLMEIWNALLYISGLDDLTKFEYEDLKRFVKQRRGIVAREESYATGLLTVITGEGTITAGDLFETPDKLQYEAVNTVNVLEGDSFTVRCLIAGPDGNVPANMVTVIPKTINGIVKVSNLEPIGGGYEKESKESIIQRYEDDLQNPITSGNIYHYKKWATSITGVGKVDVKPLWNGDNTVKVIIIDSNMEPAETALVNEVQQYIDPYTIVDGVKIGWGCGNGQAPIGAYCTVESASKLELQITFKGKLKTGTTEELAEKSVTESILNYLHSIAMVDEETYVSYAQIGRAILSSDGIADYSDLLINGGTDNIAISNTDTDREVAILDTLAMEVE